MDKVETRNKLEDAWNRWLGSCEYARKQKDAKFFKRFCIYVCLMWNKADADAQLLRHMFMGSAEGGWHGDITPTKVPPSVHYWEGLFAEDVEEVLGESDLDLHVDLVAFLHKEYMRVFEGAALPLSLRQLFARALPQKAVEPNMIGVVIEVTDDGVFIEESEK